MKIIILFFEIFFIANFTLGQSACPDGPANKYKNLAIEHKGSGNIDAQAYSQAAMYEIGVCACLSGELLPEADVQGLKVKSEAAKAEAQRLKSGLSFRPWPSKCKFKGSDGINSGDDAGIKSKKQFGDMLVGGEISDLAGGFIHDIAQYSDNPKIINLSKEVGQIQEKYGDLRNLNNQLSGIFGVNPADNEAMQIYEVAQAVEIGAEIVKTLFGKNEEKQLTKDQLQVEKAFKINAKNLRVLHDEVAKIELPNEVNTNFISSLYEKELEFEKYTAFTAADRYMCLWYIKSGANPEPVGVAEYNAELNKIQDYTLNELLNEIEIIKQEINTFYEVKLPSYMANRREAFEKTDDEIILYKILYFNQTGHNDISQYYLSNFIGSEDFSVKETREWIKKTIESQPKKAKTTVDISDREITIKHLKFNEKIWDCYSIPLNQGEYVIKNEVILSMNNFSLAPKDFKSPIKFDHCEDNVYYPSITYFLEHKEDAYLGTEMESALNSLVSYHKYVEFKKTNEVNFSNVQNDSTHSEYREIVKNERQKIAYKKGGQTPQSSGKSVTYKWEEYNAQYRDGKFGFVDKNGDTVIPFQFDLASNFSEGLASVDVNGKSGFINENGEFVIPLRYSYTSSFHNGVAIVKFPYGSGYGYIDKKGNLIIPDEYGDANNFSEGLAKVRKDKYFTQKYGYIDKRGNTVIPFIYKEASDFNDGKAKVKSGLNTFYIDKEGNKIK